MEHPSHHPISATISGIFFVIGAILSKIQLHPVSPAVLSYMQFASFSVAIIAGLLSIRKSTKKKK